MIDYGESDNMIEICGKVDKSNTKKLFTGAMFHPIFHIFLS